MIWQGTTLVNWGADATIVAEVDDTHLHFGNQALRFISQNPTDIRAVAGDGTAFSVHKAGLTVSRYLAECGGRSYELNRTGGKRREIIDSAGRIAARSHGRGHELDVVPVAGELDLDLVFMSWALTLVDAPARRTLR